MEDTRIARKVYMWNEKSSKWKKKCTIMVDRSGLLVMWVHRFSEGKERVYE